MNKGINLVIPITYDSSDGPYRTTKNIMQSTYQNIMTLFYCSSGERVMDIDFGIGIKNYVFENMNDITIMKLRKEISDQFSRYLPYVRISSLDFNFDEVNHVCLMKMLWGIVGTNINSQLNFTIGSGV